MTGKADIKTGFFLGIGLFLALLLLGFLQMLTLRAVHKANNG